MNTEGRGCHLPLQLLPSTPPGCRGPGPWRQSCPPRLCIGVHGSIGKSRPASCTRIPDPIERHQPEKMQALPGSASSSITYRRIKACEIISMTLESRSAKGEIANKAKSKSHSSTVRSSWLTKPTPGFVLHVVSQRVAVGSVVTQKQCCAR